MRRIVFVIILPFFLPLILFAQAPEKINYQAVIRGPDGTVLQDAMISMRFSIHQGNMEGQIVYSEIHQMRTNEFGLVNLAVGTGDSESSFNSIDWAGNNNLWLKIETDHSGGSDFRLMGGMELVSVPYAFYASQAGYAPPVLLIKTDAEREIIENPSLGLMIFNSTTNKINIFQTDGWYEFSGEKITESFSCGKNLKDPRDEQVYKTIKIGNQCWMAENLNFGNLIDGSVDQTNNELFEKYCYQNSASLCESYGALYQWDEMMDYSIVKGSQGICPDGWHIPSDIEVQELEVALGMDPAVALLANTWRGTDQGTKMAPGGESGFDALYSGRRVTGGLYTAIDSYEYLWTSTESGSDAWRRCFRLDDPKVGRFNTFPKSYGMSVRCVQD